LKVIANDFSSLTDAEVEAINCFEIEENDDDEESGGEKKMTI
jgi:hypothetical protein